MQTTIGATTHAAYAARMRGWQRQYGWSKRRRYDEAGAVSDEIVFNCFGTPTDGRIWAARLYAYPWAMGQIRDRAYRYASEYRSGRLRNPVTAFQSWLSSNFPSPMPKGGRS